MQITLKKVLFVGIGILCALFFFLVAVLPVTRTIEYVGGLGTKTISGSLLGVLAGNEEAVAMVKSQINADDFFKSISVTDVEGLKKATEAYQAAQDGLVTAYRIFAVLAIILFVTSLLALIGGFFMKSIRGTRKLGIPFLAIDIVLSLVVMIFAILMTFSTDMIGAKTASVSVGGPIIMYLLGIAAFIGMLVASGVVKEKVLVGKKESK